MAAVASPTRRERARMATVEEIKATARSLMHEQGTTDVRFTDIARVMGMTPPALYRYFAGRDELLTTLIADAYTDLGERVAQARESVDADDIGARWVAAAGAYREWARAEPQQFALLFGLPVPGYVAPEEGPTTEAANRAMGQLAQLFVGAQLQGRLGPPLIREVAAAMVTCEESKHDELVGVVPAENFQAMLHAWAMLHGFTCLEAYGHLDWMDGEARDALFRSQVLLAAIASGLPLPCSG